MLDQLKEDVLRANLQLVEHRLVSLTWGNVSGFDRQRGYVVIKPSGVSYAEMTAEDMVVVDLQGRNIQGTLHPSSDTPTHVALYRAWPEIGGVAHTHSPMATAFAQACREIPCLGTTHADHFHGTVRVAPALMADQVEDDYEANTGQTIIACMGDFPPLELPGILAAHHRRGRASCDCAGGGCSHGHGHVPAESIGGTHPGASGAEAFRAQARGWGLLRPAVAVSGPIGGLCQ